jgi:membrane protein implicated in regulation of membrane protease activity
MTLLWWHWLLLALFLLLLELAAAGGFYFIFFGFAALIVGLLAWVDAAGSMPTQVLLFSVVAVLSLVFFRRRLLVRVQPDPQAPPVDQLAGEIGTAVEDLLPGQVGRVELRGSSWAARNSSARPVVRGQRCRVRRVDGLTLEIEPEGGQ